MFHYGTPGRPEPCVGICYYMKQLEAERRQEARKRMQEEEEEGVQFLERRRKKEDEDEAGDWGEIRMHIN